MPNIEEIKSYTYPKLYEGKEWYVAWKSYDPATARLKLKRVKINHIGSTKAKRDYARGLIARISAQLDRGWNPWLEQMSSNNYHTWDDVIEQYKKYINKLTDDGCLREKTCYGYLSMLNQLTTYNQALKIPISYIYQFDSRYINEFLDHLYLTKGCSARTRNNYLTWLSTLCTFLVSRQYLKDRPVDCITPIRRSGRGKNREVISGPDMRRLRDYLSENNKHYLLACYMLHYVLIRPREMSYIRLRDFHLAKQTVCISGEYSKNRKDAVVTLPAHVIHLMVELKIFDSPSDYYLFSDGFRPGAKHKSEKTFRDYWTNTIRKALNFPLKYKFYSLKDTGITNMLRSCDVISVRDQARHSSILMTDIYTPDDIREANKLLLDYKSDF